MIYINILVILLLIGLNAFFVSVEFAAVTSRRARLDLIAGEDNRSARLVHKWLEDPSARERLIAASQLGVTMASLALGAVGENTFKALLEPYFASVQVPAWFSFTEVIFPALPLIISLVVVTSFHVVLGEQVPKVVVLRSPERFALWAAQPMEVFNRLFKAFISLLDGATHAVLHLFGLRGSSEHSSNVSLEEFKQLVAGPEMEGLMEEPEREMLSAVMDFNEMLVRQVTVPRTEIVAVEAETPLDEVIKISLEHSYTKLPVYDDTLDQIIGIIHLHDLLQCIQDNSADGKTARSLAREALFVPETAPMTRLLHEFRSRRVHIAIVLDEFGGTAGLVTLEDLLDEIVGEVQDDFNASPPDIQPQTDGSFLLDGMTMIEEVNEHFDLNLHDPNYDTIAGYILGKLGRLATAGDMVEDGENGISLKVVAMDHLRISQVLMKKILPEVT